MIDRMPHGEVSVHDAEAGQPTKDRRHLGFDGVPHKGRRQREQVGVVQTPSAATPAPTCLTQVSPTNTSRASSRI